MNYRMTGSRPSDLVRLGIDINSTSAPALSQIAHRSPSLELGKKMVRILREEVPRQRIKIVIQARIGAHIVAHLWVKSVQRETIAKLYGAHMTRQKGVLDKQAVSNVETGKHF